MNLRIESLVAPLGAVSDLEKGMKEALDHGDGSEESLPRLLGGDPAIGIDGLGGVVRVEGVSLILEVIPTAGSNTVNG